VPDCLRVRARLQKNQTAISNRSWEFTNSAVQIRAAASCFVNSHGSAKAKILKTTSQSAKFSARSALTAAAAGSDAAGIPKKATAKA